MPRQVIMHVRAHTAPEKEPAQRAPGKLQVREGGEGCTVIILGPLPRVTTHRSQRAPPLPRSRISRAESFRVVGRFLYDARSFDA